MKALGWDFDIGGFGDYWCLSESYQVDAGWDFEKTIPAACDDLVVDLGYEFYWVGMGEEATDTVVIVPVPES